MSDDGRLGKDGSDLERSLLASAAADQPDEAAKNKARAALGLAVGGAAIATTAVTNASSGASAAAGSTAATIKWAIGLVLGLSTVGGVYVATSTPPQKPKAQPTTIIAPTPKTAIEVAPKTVEPAEPPAVVADEATQSVTAPKPPKAASKPAKQVQTEKRVVSTLVKEVALIDLARAALKRGDATEAQRLIERYTAEFPSGALLEEAAIVSIDIAIAQKDVERATSLAKQFVKDYPSSPSADRIRRLAKPSTIEK